jgi:D-alanyl-D-alanine carboxypeptidase
VTRPPAPSRPAFISARFRSLLRILPALLLCLLSAPAALAAPQRAPDPPQITAKAAIVVEWPSGKILYEKNARQRLPEASTTKTMTALLVLQRVSVTDVITATADDLVGESSMGLVEGEQQTTLNMLYGLMLPSGNDAAMALARHVGEGLKEPANVGPVQRFVALMNQQAQAMGLADTHFMNPHGLDDPNHYTTAYDLASIAWYDLHNPLFNEIIKQVYHSVPGHDLTNTNELLTRYDGADGVKTGMTDAAGNCLVSSVTRGGRRLVTVTLGEPYGHTYPDTMALLDYGFAQPADDKAESLTIARRAQALWYLASGIPTPLPTPRPTATATPQPAASLLNLGGLLAAQPAASGPAAVSGGGAGGGPAATTLAATTGGGPPWLWSLLAVPAGALILLAFWRANLVSRRRAAPAAATALAVAGPAVLDPAARAGDAAVGPIAPVAESAAVAAPAARPARGGKNGKPGAAPTPPPRRVNLLTGEDLNTRAERAIALAYRGQEGSSLAEFLMIIKTNPEFEFGALPGFYDMPAAGYMALARAYAEHDRRRYATALLKLALESYPDDRPLARMLAEVDDAGPDVILPGTASEATS